MADICFKNKIGLVLEGGGTLGIAHVGALVKLEQMGYLRNFRFFAGSSVGSIISGALACGADAITIKNIMAGLDFEKFKDDSWNPVCDIARLLEKYGWYKGEYMQKWYRGVIETLTGDGDITLREIYDKYGNYLIITAFNVDKAVTEYYTPESRPDMPLHVAVRRSSGIPLFFEAMRTTPGQNGDPPDDDVYLIVDGGWLDNYPMHTLYHKLHPDQVVGFKLCNTSEVYDMMVYDNVFNRQNKRAKINTTCDRQVSRIWDKRVEEPDAAGDIKTIDKVDNIIDFIFILMNSARNMAMKVHVHHDDWKRTVKINVGDFTATSFDMTAEEKKWLYQSGYNAIQDVCPM
jgi:NTE family protein